MNEANIERVKRPENRLPPQANKSRFVMDESQLKKKKFNYDAYGYDVEPEKKEEKP